jgi:two-component system NtrC family sensor kinase
MSERRDEPKEALPAIFEALESAGRAELAAELRRRVDEDVRKRAMAEITRELDPMSLFDPTTGALLDVNDAWVALYGYSREEALAGLKVTDVSAEPEVTKAAVAHSAKGAERAHVRWHRAKDGTVFPVELACGRLAVGDREAGYAVMRDITERLRAQRALERSEASFRALIESMPDGAIVHRDGAVVYMNLTLRAMLGFGADEDLRGTKVLDLVHPDERERVRGRLRELTEHGSSVPLREERLLRKDGTCVVAEIAAHAVAFDGESCVLAIARDVSERKSIEAQLLMSDRLASLGRLSASIGHELNNPLGYILGNMALLERELTKGDVPAQVAERLMAHVTMVKEGATRMRNIVHDLKMLARGEGDQTVVTDLAHILDVCVNMAESELRGRARVVKRYGERIFVRGTEARLGQVFLNLLLNAAQAIPEGDPAHHEVCVAVVAYDRSRVEVHVGDTGEGVSAENRDRIFEPFFTTKQGEGTGLGLSISHRIVTSLGGTISVEPRPGGGSLFRVVLPSPDATPQLPR